MTAVDLAGIESKRDELIRKGIAGAVFIASTDATAIAYTNLFDADSGGLSALPTAGGTYEDLGRCSTAGVVFARKVTSTDIDGWGTNDPVRSDITADVTTIKVDGYETKALTISQYTGVDVSDMTPDATNGTFEVDVPTAPSSKYVRILALAVDGSPGDEFVVARFMPRCKITDYTDQSYANDKDPIVWGATFQAYKDSTLGFAQRQLYGGEQIIGSLASMGFPRVVTCTTATTTALVATAGKFLASDVGLEVAATGKITPGTTIESYTDATHVTMSAVGLGAGTGIAVTVGPD